MARELTACNRSDCNRADRTRAFPPLACSLLCALSLLPSAPQLPARAGGSAAEADKPPEPRLPQRGGREPDSRKTVDAKMAYLETMTLGQVMDDDSFEKRLEHLERLVLGKSEPGNPNLRLARLMQRVSSDPAFGGSMHLKGGVAKSNLDEEGERLLLDTHGDGSGKLGRSRLRALVRTTRALRVTISIGGSHFVHSFNDRLEIDRAISEFARYVGDYLKDAPVTDRASVRLTLKNAGPQSKFSGITVGVPQARGVPAISSFGIVENSQPDGTSRIATAGFAAFSHTDGSVSYSHGGSVAASKPAVSSLHLSPLIIHVSAGGSDVSGSFNNALADRLSELIRDGNLKIVPSARPYALSVSMGPSRLSNSFDIGSGKSAQSSINAFAASSDFQDQSRGEIDPDGNEVRPLLLSISAGGSHIDSSFNNTGGVVRLANEIADQLEAYVKPAALAGISQIHLSKGGCQLENVFSK